jgi:hypothetical protein
LFLSCDWCMKGSGLTPPSGSLPVPATAALLCCFLLGDFAMEHLAPMTWGENLCIDDDFVDSFLLRRCFGSLPADLRNNEPDTSEVHQEEKMGLLIPVATPSSPTWRWLSFAHTSNTEQQLPDAVGAIGKATSLWVLVGCGEVDIHGSTSSFFQGYLWCSWFTARCLKEDRHGAASTSFALSWE